METRNDSFDLTPYLGDGFGTNIKSAANDADSTDERFEKLVKALAFWKRMPAWRVKTQTFAERIERRAMLEQVRAFEARYGVLI